MTDLKTTVEPIEPITVTVVGGTGDGGASPLTTGTVGTTPDHQPNIVVKVVTPLATLVIRFVNNFFIIFIPLVGAGMGSDLLPATDFENLVIKCAKLAVGAAAFAFIKDVATIFSGLERKFPLWTGSV